MGKRISNPKKAWTKSLSKHLRTINCGERQRPRLARPIAQAALRPTAVARQQASPEEPTTRVMAVRFVKPPTSRTAACLAPS